VHSPPLVGLKPHTIQNMISDGRLKSPAVVWVLGHARIDYDKFVEVHVTTEKPVRNRKPPGRLRAVEARRRAEL
jgi:hypothetical protein